MVQTNSSVGPLPVICEQDGVLDEAVWREFEGFGHILAKFGEGEDIQVYICSQSGEEERVRGKRREGK